MKIRIKMNSGETQIAEVPGKTIEEVGIYLTKTPILKCFSGSLIFSKSISSIKEIK